MSEKICAPDIPHTIMKSIFLFLLFGLIEAIPPQPILDELEIDLEPLILIEDPAEPPQLVEPNIGLYPQPILEELEIEPAEPSEDCKKIVHYNIDSLDNCQDFCEEEFEFCSEVFYQEENGTCVVLQEVTYKIIARDKVARLFIECSDFSAQ